MKHYYHQIHCTMYRPFHWNIQKKLQQKHEEWARHQSNELDNVIPILKKQAPCTIRHVAIIIQYFTNQMNLIM